MTLAGGSNHYKSGSIEPLELIEAQSIGFHLGNVIKYAVRASYYTTKVVYSVENLKIAHAAIDKAIWYLKRWQQINPVIEDAK